MKKWLLSLLLATLAVLSMTVPVSSQGSLSRQVLLLLERNNTWTGDQTFGDITITGTCTGCGGAGGGTVTSVALSLPAEFTVSGSPIVGAGTLTGSWANASANTLFAGPSSGAATTPAFRALVDDDVPNNITISGTNNVTWASVNKTGSSLADLATRAITDLTGTLPLASLTDGGTAGIPLVAGGGAGDPNYAAIDVSGAAITGTLKATAFPALSGDGTTPGGSLVFTLSNSGVTASTYGSSTTIPQITVDAKGRITAASSVALAAHNLLSATHGDTLTASVARGDVLIGNSTPKWARLAKGAAGTVLQSDGTDVAWSTSGAALTALNATQLTSGTVPLARLANLTNTEIAAAAAIAWTKIADLASGDSITWTTRGDLSMTADGVWLYVDNAGTGFNGLTLGPTASRAAKGDIRLKKGGSIYAYGQAASDDYGTIYGSQDLVDATPTNLFTIALPNDSAVGGGLTYTVEVTDGTDFQAHSGYVSFAAANKAGAFTTAIGEATAASGIEQAALTGGSTLTDAWTIATAAGQITIQANYNTSLTPTMMRIRYTLFINGPNTVTIH